MRLPFPHAKRRQTKQTHAQQAEAKKTVFRIEVTLLSGPVTRAFIRENPKPPRRTLEMVGSQSLEKLHTAIFDAFDRYDEHMYEFQVGGKKPMDRKAARFGIKMADDFMDDDTYNAAKTSIASLNVSLQEKFFYWFDFGDDWWHELKIVDILPLEESVKKFPRVVASFGESPEQYPDFDEDEDEDEGDDFLGLSAEEIVRSSRYQEISNHLEAFTKKHLNEEYFTIAQAMLLTLFNSTLDLERSKAQSWAAGIMHAVGWVNFLGDPARTVHMPLKDIAKHFTVATGTMESKSRDIRAELELIPLEPSYCTEENLEDNPMQGLISLENLLHNIQVLSVEKADEAQTASTQASFLSFLQNDKKD